MEADFCHELVVKAENRLKAPIFMVEDQNEEVKIDLDILLNGA